MTKYYLLSFSLFFLLAGCGGGGGGGGSSSAPQPDVYSGSLNRATAESTNSEALSRGVVEATHRLTEYGEADISPDDFLRASSQQTSSFSLVDAGQQTLIAEFYKGLSSQDANTASRFDETESCSFGGKVRAIFPDVSKNAETLPTNGSGSLVFTDCDEFDAIFDGIMAFSWRGFDDDTFEFRSFTATFNILVTEPGQSPFRIRGKLVCSNFGLDCDLSEDFTGSGSVDYRVEDVETSGSSFSGYGLNARVYHQSYGYVDIVATDIVFCDNGNIQSGTISVVDASAVEVIVIAFSNCDEFTVTFDGVATVYNQ
jgi:hypothetical protein